MKLHSFFNSSTSYRVRIALALKGLEYEYLPLNIRIGVQSEEPFVSINPMKGVPVLEDGDFRLTKYLTQELKIDEGEKKRWYQHWITQGFRAVEQKLKESYSGTYCFGDKVSLADVCLVPQYANAQRMGCDLDEFVLCKKVFDYCLVLDAFKQADPKQQPDYIA